MILYLRRKLNIKYAFAAFCILSVIIFLIDLKLIHELATKAFSCTLPVRGVHYTMGSFYVPDEYQKFKCITNDDVISFDKVNDDYCDCNDGSDEPGTAACPNGVFYCESDIYKRSAVPLPTNRVNDGICDCCDGSDEWQKINFPSAMPEHVQHLIGSYRTECPNEC